jgi:hypothetical protein
LGHGVSPPKAVFGGLDATLAKASRLSIKRGAFALRWKDAAARSGMPPRVLFSQIVQFNRKWEFDPDRSRDVDILSLKNSDLTGKGAWII